MQRGQGPADLPEPEEDDLHPLGLDDGAPRDARELEGRMDAPQRLAGLGRLDDHRDVQLGRALRDGHHVDPRGCERREHAGGNAGHSVHAEPHDGDGGHAGRHLDAVDLAAGDLGPEFALEALAGVGGGGLGDAEANRMLGGGLRDQRDRDLPRVQRREGASRDAGHAQHAVARDGHQRLPHGGGEGLDREPGSRHPLRDLGAVGRRVRERTHEDGNAPPCQRNERARMQHLGAVVRQLRRLAGVKLGNDAGVRDDSRVGGEEAGHVLPQGNPRGAECPGHQRRGEVGAPASERRDLALGSGPDEAGDHRDDAPGEQRQHDALGAAVGASVVGRRAAEGIVGVDDVERLDVAGPRARGIEGGRDEPRAEPFAARDEIVGGPRRELAEKAEAPGQRFQLVERLGDVGERVGPPAPRGEQRPRHLGVPRAQARDEGRDGARVAGSSLPRHGEERVGRPRHRGDDHDGGLRTKAVDDVDGVADGGGIGQRRTAELVHVRRSARSRHRGERITGLAVCWLLAAGLTPRSSR